MKWIKDFEIFLSNQAIHVDMNFKNLCNSIDSALHLHIVVVVNRKEILAAIIGSKVTLKV